MANHKFNLEQLYDVIEVGEHKFELNLNDERLRNFRKMAHDYQEEAQQIAKVDVDTLDEAGVQELERKASELLQNTIDGILGVGSYTKVYETVGRNTFNVVTFIEYLFGVLEEKLKESKLLASKKYTNKAKAEKVIAAKKAGR